MKSQTNRLLAYLRARPWQVLPAPELNAACAGEGQMYVSAFSKRISDCRAIIQAQGGDLVLAYDQRINGQRRTAYRYVPPKAQNTLNAANS